MVIIQLLHSEIITPTTVCGSLSSISRWYSFSFSSIAISHTGMISHDSAIYKLNGKWTHYPITDKTTVIKFSLEKKMRKEEIWPQFLYLCIQATEKKKVYLIPEMVKYLTEIKPRIRE